VTRSTLAGRNPLIFINACRSAGTTPEYTRMTGWAQQFMAAGAGAFVGTLWAVRDDGAGRFAEAFYGALRGGRPLGEAARAARQHASQDSTDPTWLAYTVYGSPAAYVTG
jgi:CHAT domain-containing protein